MPLTSGGEVPLVALIIRQYSRRLGCRRGWGWRHCLKASAHAAYFPQAGFLVDFLQLLFRGAKGLDGLRIRLGGTMDMSPLEPSKAQCTSDNPRASVLPEPQSFP